MEHCPGCKRKGVSDCPYYEQGILLSENLLPDGTFDQKKHYVFRDGCFWDLVSDEISPLIDMYKHYKNGYLWFDPVIGHNPAWYVNAMLLIDLKMKVPKIDL